MSFAPDLDQGQVQVAARQSTSGLVLCRHAPVQLLAEVAFRR
jgi:hypothetical protein